MEIDLHRLRFGMGFHFGFKEYLFARHTERLLDQPSVFSCQPPPNTLA